MELAALKTAENLVECREWPGELVHAGVGIMWESRLVSESSTHHPSKVSQLGYSL